MHLNLSSPVHLFTSKSPESPKIKVCLQPDSSFLHRPSACQKTSSTHLSGNGSQILVQPLPGEDVPVGQHLPLIPLALILLLMTESTSNDAPHPIVVPWLFPLELQLRNCGHAIFPSSATQDVLKASHTFIYPSFILCIYTKRQYLLSVPRSVNSPANTDSQGNQQNRK